MTTKAKGGWGSYEFTRPAYDEQRECEKAYCVQITVELDTSFQKGVYRLRVTSRPVFQKDGHLRHAVSCDWPSSTAQSFEACLYQQVYKIARMVEQAYADAARQQEKLTKGR